MKQHQGKSQISETEIDNEELNNNAQQDEDNEEVVEEDEEDTDDTGENEEDVAEVEEVAYNNYSLLVNSKGKNEGIIEPQRIRKQ